MRISNNFMRGWENWNGSQPTYANKNVSHSRANDVAEFYALKESLIVIQKLQRSLSDAFLVARGELLRRNGGMTLQSEPLIDVPNRFAETGFHRAYCLLASPLMVSPEPEVLLRMKYPLPSSTITDTCVLLMGAPQLSVTVQSGLTE